MSVLLSGADVVDLAVQTEVRGEQFYRQAAQKADREEARQLFRYLADEEVRHKHIFENLGTQIVFTQTESADWQEAMDYIAATVEGQFFQKDAPIRAVPEGATTEEMLRQAIAFEKQTLLFFHTLQDLIQKPNRPLIDKIVAEERRHVVRLAEMLRSK
ncbi:MAG: ferritin family protein [Chloroflexi bacterium]|nr:ferritin family protein [Chloroflexota bacterium]